jgi:uncharacterized membrane protein
MFNWIDLLFLFAAGSIAGWLIELLHRKNLKKLTSGFLNGPYLPVYGFGLILIYVISLFEINIILRIISFAVLITTLELITGIIFVKYFKIKLWDYSNDFLNFRGIICPLYSFYFVAMSLLFYFFAFPWVKIALNLVEGNHIAYFVLGVFYTVFLIDTIVSFRIAAKIKAAVAEFNQTHIAKVVVDYSKFRDSVVEYLKKTGETNCVLRFIFTVHNLVSNEIKNQIERFLKKK